MESALADALIGRVLDRRYHVRSRIAHGGMATVYLATDTRLDRQVALKVMHAELARDEEFVSRFIGEAKSVARLSHPNIVAVFDQGSDGQFLYLAMEYVPGRTLRSLLRERGRFPADAALGITDAILSGLAAAHAAGIVHRDVKPENVLLTADGRCKVCDFGLARAQAATGQTRTGLVIGTVAYIAPEQVTGHVTDFRTDVYAAGVLLFELLTGHQPHTGESPLAVAYKHVNSDVPAPSDWIDGVPRALDLLVLAATSRDPQRRPANAGAFLRAVRAARAGADPGMVMSAAMRPAAGMDLVPGNGQHAPGRAGVPGGSTLLGAPPGPGAYDEADAGAHTMVVPGYPADGMYPYPADAIVGPGWDGDGPGRGPGRGWGRHSRRGRGNGAGGGALSPFLARWQFSRRLAYIAAGVAALLVVAIGGWALSAPGSTQVAVPSVTGVPASQAEAMLRADGFAVTVGKPAHDNAIPKGDVLSTSPSGSAPRGTTVVITLSSGPAMITIPPVTGQSFDAAVAVLRKAGLTVGGQPQKVAQAGVPVGSVAGTNPPAGTSWPSDKVVYVEVAAGVPLPNLTGQDEHAVQVGWAQPNGITLNVQQDTNSSQPAGIITGQSPAPGTPVAAGSTVTVNVSTGPAAVPIPNVTGENINQATQDLQNAGFQVNAIQVGPTQRVIIVKPTGSAPKGSTIDLYYGF